MAVTLNEMLKLSRSKIGKAILIDLLRQSRILQLIPVENVDAFKVTDTRWQTLPSAGTRKIGGVYTEGTGKVEQVEDTLHIYGGEISVDRMLLKVNSQQNPIQLQSQMKVASLVAKFNDHFINNDHATGDVDGFEGLKKRVSNLSSRMTVDLATSGDSLKVLASSSTILTFVNGLHTALHRVGATIGDAGNSNIVMLMNETTLLGIGNALRQSGLLSDQKDIYDRTWTMFGPAKLVDVGLKSDQETNIILDTEDPGDGGNDSSSIYLVRLGGIQRHDASGRVVTVDDDGLKLIQINGTSPEPYDPLKGAEAGLGANPGYLRRIDWGIGLKQAGRYSVARVKGFKMAAS